MSGICGQFSLDNKPAALAELQAMTSLLARRGPEATAHWHAGPVALGHTLLATTPELLFERQPFAHHETGCVITADVRLDNREQLLAALQLAKRPDTTGDAELILSAYLEWGDACLDRLLGDFAFALWDPRHEKLFCARDHFGMRPFYYHHAPGQHFLFASDARSILVLPQVPFRINEGRIADFLVPELEWIDYTSTFYEHVFRLPPGHKLTVTLDTLRIAEYWKPVPGPELGASSDDDYRQGFIEVFTTAIRSRLRAPAGTVGAMLSGGMDSGSVVAFAKTILADSGQGPLATFSASRQYDPGNPQGPDCPESRAIYAASRMPAISPTLIHPEALDAAFQSLSTGFDEPFDGVFAFLKAIYIAAHDRGCRVLLDGGGGDVVLGEGTYIVRLIRSGHWRRALSEIVAEQQHEVGGSPAASLIRYARSALLPEAIKKPFRGTLYRRRCSGFVKASLVSNDFARRVAIDDRFEHMRAIFPGGWTADYAAEYCDKIRPNMTAGRERYARIAASAGMEARDPFMDRRVIAYCSRLPGRLRLKDGWPKRILREITADTLPTDVLWTPRKPHLGWLFSKAMNDLAVSRGELDLPMLQDQLKGYVEPAALQAAWRNYRAGGDAEQVHYAAVLSLWLRANAARPVVPS